MGNSAKTSQQKGKLKRPGPVRSASRTIIIGGGVSGLSIAYWLRKAEPTADLLLIRSQKEALRAASLLNAGFLTVGSRDFYANLSTRLGRPLASEVLEFCQTNHDLLALEGLLDQCKSYRRCGSFSISSSKPEKDVPEFLQETKNSTHSLKIEASSGSRTHSTSTREQQESSTSWISPSERCLVNDGELSWFYAGDGSIEPSELLRTIENRSQFELKVGTATKLSRHRTELETGEVIKADRVVVATNAWMHSLLPARWVTPTRAQALLSSPLAGGAWPGNYYFSDDKAYVRIRPDGRLVAGGMRNLDEITECTSKLELNPVIQQGLERLIKSRFSGDLKVEKRWAGIMGFTESQLPIAGIQNGVYFMGGFSGHGMGMAFHLAKQLAGLILNRAPLPEWTSTNCSN